MSGIQRWHIEFVRTDRRRYVDDSIGIDHLRDARGLDPVCDRRGIEAATEDEYRFRHGWMVGDIEFALLGLTDDTNLGELTMTVATTVVAVAALLSADREGHVRARAAWAASQFAETVSKDAEFSQQIVTGVMSQLRDTDFAVRFQAAVSLRHLIYDSEEGQARPSVLPIVEKVLPQLLDELFKLMDEIGNDELVATLEVLIEAFSEHMAPYAQGLCQRLAQHFVRLAISESGQEAEEEASFAAVGICRDGVAQ